MGEIKILNDKINDYYYNDPDEFKAASSEFQKLIDTTQILQMDGKVDISSVPIVIPEQMCSQITANCIRILELLYEIPDRFFNNNFADMLAYIGVPVEYEKVFLKTYYDNPLRMCRCDVFIDENGHYKILEYNIDSNVGGLESAGLNKIILKNKFNSTYINKNNLYYIDPLEKLCEALAELNVKSIAIVDFHEYIEGYLPSLKLIQDYFISNGFKTFIGTQRDLTYDNKLYMNNNEIDFVFKVFFNEDVFDKPEEFEAIFKAYDNKNIQISSGLHNSLFSNKALLALLFEDKFQKNLNEDEINLIKKYLPWSYILNSDTKTDNIILQNKDNYVLKPAVGHGGSGVELGWNLNEEEWSNKLHAASLSNIKYIIQEKINTETLSIFKNDGSEIVNIKSNWGFYIFNNKFSGIYYRYLVGDKLEVINTTQGASIAPVFISKGTN